MNLITCSHDCVYQKDGYCNLEHAASMGTQIQQDADCIYYIRREKGATKKPTGQTAPGSPPASWQLE